MYARRIQDLKWIDFDLFLFSIFSPVHPAPVRLYYQWFFFVSILVPFRNLSALSLFLRSSVGQVFTKEIVFLRV